jgi:hypothetical protein
MDLDVVRRNADLLPEAPRKVKALVRNLMTLGPLMKRHDPAEVDWLDLFFGQLLRLESPSLIESFLTNGNAGLIEVEAYQPKHADQPPFEKRLEEAIKDCGILDQNVRSRLLKVISAWVQRRAWIGGKHFGYYAGFGSIHRDITEGEFQNLLQAYLTSRDFDALALQLNEHAAHVSSPLADVAQEFLKILIEMRSASLAAAADSEMESDAVGHLAAAHEYLNLVEVILDHPASAFCQSSAFRRTVIQSVAAQVLMWMHFHRTVYRETRLEERRFLLSLASRDVVTGFDWLELLIWDSSLFISEEAQQAAEELNWELLKIVHDRVVDEALEVVRSESGHLEINGPKASRASRFCFFDRKSPLWSDAGRQQLFDVLAQAAVISVVRQNASELLRCLAWSHPAPGLFGDREEFAEILKLPGVARALWAAACAQPAQYRFQQRLIEMRDATVKIGIAEDELLVPHWLTGRCQEMKMRPPAGPIQS